MSRTIILCDIDGVIADCDHRLHFLKDKDYDSFYGACMADDKAIDVGIKLLKSIRDTDYKADVYFLTGRPERTRSLTKLWVENKARIVIEEGHLIMRRDGDYRPSPEIKIEQVKKALGANENMIIQITRTILAALQCTNEDELPPVVYFIDDDPENVKAVCKAFPRITGITFGIKRMEQNE